MLIEQLIECFENETKEIKQHIDFVEEIFKKYRLLIPNAAKNHFAGVTRIISEEVTTELELIAIQKALVFCYEYYSSINKAIIPPNLVLPVPSQRPFFNESTAIVAYVGAVIKFARENISSCDQAVKALSAAILIANIRGKFELEQLFESDQIYVLTDANRALLVSSKDYLMMDSISLLLWKILRGAVKTANELRLIYKKNYSKDFGNISSLDNAIASICTFNHCIFTHSFKSIQSNLPAIELINYLTNQQVRMLNIEQERKIHRHWECDYNNDLKVMTSIAFASKKFDNDAIAELSLHLRRFKQRSENEARNKIYFSECCDSLENLKIKCISNCSVVAYVIVSYSISLFLNGSAWKEKLAVNTILTYLSTIHNFCRIVFRDSFLIDQAQENDDALHAISEVIEDCLSYRSANKQSIILIFLQYLNQNVPVRLVDSSLDFYSIQSERVRRHYLTPQNFDLVIHKIKNEQMRWFLRLCYWLGLRHEEAIQLHVVDITKEFLYVTKRSKRKTLASIRRISLMNMPEYLRNELAKYLKYRHQISNKMFDEKLIDLYLQDALELLRKTSGNDYFVVHSLRHCAANNFLFLLIMATRDYLEWRERYALFRHECFSDASILKIQHQFAMLGEQLSELTPIMNIVARQLGHSSPVVTALCYLHFLPFINSEINFQSKNFIEADFISSLIKNNSYRYECINFEGFDYDVWFKRACRGLARIEFSNNPNNSIVQDVCLSDLNFIDYMNDLFSYIQTDTKSEVFSNINDVPVVDVELLSIFMHECSNVRQIESISKVKWNSKRVRAIKVLNETINNGFDIVDVRTLRHVLFALNLLGYQSLEAIVNGAYGIPQKWIDTANNFNCKLFSKVGSNSLSLVKLNSFRNKRSKIKNLDLICNVLVCFLNKKLR